MGTPHRGSAMAKYGVIVARIAKVFIKKDDRLLKTLEEGSDILEKQRSDFDTFSHGMRLVCLYEAQDLDGVRVSVCAIYHDLFSFHYHSIVPSVLALSLEEAPELISV